MKRLSVILLLALAAAASFATRIIPADYIQVTPTNAPEHRISFSCGTNSDSVIIAMPFTKGEFAYDDTVIDFTNSARHFQIPIKGMKMEGGAVETKKAQDMILVSFWMDRQTLRESSLKIYFKKDEPSRFTVYMLSPRDFVPKENVLPKK